MSTQVGFSFSTGRLVTCNGVSKIHCEFRPIKFMTDVKFGFLNLLDDIPSSKTYEKMQNRAA